MIEQNYKNGDHYELILMDCNMPIMDGYQATEEIRKVVEKYGSHQPFIVGVTGHVG